MQLISLMRDHLVFYGYRLLARFAEVLPSKAILPMSTAAGRVGAFLFRKKRRIVERNLQRVTQKPVTQSQINKTFASYARYWLDTLRLPTVSLEQLDKLVSETGKEHIEEALSKGKGAIIAIPHVSNWDLTGTWLVQHGVPMTVVVERLNPPKLFTWFRDFRESLGFRVVTNGPKITSDLLKTLRKNEVVALLCDRDVTKSGHEYEFFGEKTTMPEGPAMLALRSGAVLLPIVVYEDDYGYRAVVDEPVPVERNGRLREDVERITKELNHRIEALIRQAPEQWHLFQPNWPSD